MLRLSYQSPLRTKHNQVILINELDNDVLTLEEPAFVFNPKMYVRSLRKDNTNVNSMQKHKIRVMCDKLDFETLKL